MSVTVALQYGKSLLKVPFRWWSGADMRGDVGPFWASNAPVPGLRRVQNDGCSCAGLVNLIRRRIGLSVPGAARKSYRYPGGTDCWFRYLRRRGVLQSFDPAKSYPRGTLLLRPYKNVNDQGHLAIVLNKHAKGVPYARVLHAYPLGPKPIEGRRVVGGVMVDLASNL